MNQEVIDLLADADKVLIGIGESFERKDKEFNTEEFVSFERNNPLLAGYQRLEHWKRFPRQDVVDAYNCLYRLVHNKDYFVVTTCTDDRIYESEFLKDKIVAPCGTWRFLQCSKHCTDELLPVSDEMIKTKEIIHCPHCGSEVVFNRVDCGNYNEQGYLSQWNAYRNWLQRTINQKICLIELGVGMKYPTIIRWPFEKIVYCNNKASFVRVHDFLYQMTEELNGKGLSIEAEPVKFLLE